MDCRTCWRTAPKCTLTFVVVSAAASLAMIIACLALSGGFNCYLFGAISMTPQRVFEKGEVWRLLTCYLVNPSFWGVLWVSMAFFFNGISFEAMKGTGWFVLLMVVCLLLNSLLASAFMAFFGLVPGVSSVTYFRNQWSDTTPVGSTPMLLLTVIFDTRVKRTKDVMCWCFRMPTWLYMIVLYVGCQLMMYPPWYGIFYNLCAVIIGYACPMRLLRPSARYVAMQEAAGTEVQVQRPDQAPQMYNFATINAPGQPAPQKNERLGKGHAL